MRCMDAAVTQSGHANAATQVEFSTAEAAAFLGCSVGYVQNLRQIGDGPPYQRRWKRKGIFYLRDDLVAWKAGRRYLSTADY